MMKSGTYQSFVTKLEDSVNKNIPTKTARKRDGFPMVYRHEKTYKKKGPCR